MVIPLFNEKEMLPHLYVRLNKVLPEIRKKILSFPVLDREPSIEILFVNDGSTDNSGQFLQTIARATPPYIFRYVNLSRNFGHQAAISAGLYSARGDAVVIMDCDLQDPPELIIDMLQKWQDGFDVVYAVRQKRESRLFKNISYRLYYRLNSLISDFPVQKDSGDFCLLDRKVVNAINSLPEKEKYVRGLRAWVGYKQTDILYERQGRRSGTSKYSLFSLFKLAFMGILSTSVKPLFLSGLFCSISILFILGIIVFSAASKMLLPESLMPKGWTSIMITISSLNALQLISIWFLSLYIARMYREVLRRPTYLIAYDSLKKEQNNKNKDVVQNEA